MDQGTRRTPARFLAPLALIAVLVVFLSIVSGSGGGGATNSGGSSSSTTTAQTTTTTSSKTKKKSSKTRSRSGKSSTSGGSTYTVQVGDTLGGIADKTGVPLSRIQTLNPNVDPHAMVAGQRIKLK
jgi:LysM repeat protein